MPPEAELINQKNSFKQFIGKWYALFGFGPGPVWMAETFAHEVNTTMNDILSAGVMIPCEYKNPALPPVTGYRIDPKYKQVQSTISDLATEIYEDEITEFENSKTKEDIGKTHRMRDNVYSEVVKLRAFFNGWDLPTFNKCTAILESLDSLRAAIQKAPRRPNEDE